MTVIWLMMVCIFFDCITRLLIYKYNPACLFKKELFDYFLNNRGFPQLDILRVQSGWYLILYQITDQFAYC